MNRNALKLWHVAADSVPLMVRAVFCCIALNIVWAFSPLLAVDDEAGQEGGCIRLATYSDLPMFQAMNDPIRRLYEEAGLCVELRYVPIQRAHGMQMQGRVHGQIGRTPAWLSDYGEGVVAMKEPLLRLDAMVAHKGVAIPSAFAGRIVAHRPAVVWCADWVHRSGAVPLAVQDFKDAVALLDSGRAEYLLYVSFREQSLPNLDPAMYRFDKVEDIPIYHVLSRDRGHLVPRLEAAHRRLGGPAFFEQYLARFAKVGE